MKAAGIAYVCSECGHSEPKWMGRCPECGAWNSFEEEVRVAKASKKKESAVVGEVMCLSDVKVEETIRISSGIAEFDHVLGGGIMKPASVLVGGEPGIGKSTLMIQMLSNISSKNKVLYVSGEESASQIRLRADRLGLDTGKISISCDVRLTSVLDAMSKNGPGCVVIDSLQTLYSTEISSVPGSPSQIKACCMELALLAKKLGSAIFFVAHVTKDGSIAGPKLVEHLVDTVLYFEEAETGMRLLRAAKNRFGSIDEIGLFSMDNEGLHGIKDPSSVFLSPRNEGGIPAGIVFTPVAEGSRIFTMEIQALVVPAKTGLQRIYSDKIDQARVSRVAAILQKHAGLQLGDWDIYVNVAGGVKLTEVSIELALAFALYSSKTDTPVSSDIALFGELSLAGEVRPVPFADRRIRCVEEMGFKKVLAPRGKSSKGISVINVSSIQKALIAGFGGKVRKAD